MLSVSFTRLTLAVHVDRARFDTMSSSFAPRVVVPLVVLFGLTACTAAPAPTETFAPAPDTATDPAPAITANPVEPDMTLMVRATLTAPNGAQLGLEMQVHQSTAFDDVATQTLPGALIEDCGATLNPDLFAAQAWSFTRANITAIPTASSAVDWPTDIPVLVSPAADPTTISGRGMLATDATNSCLTSKTFTGEGRGALALGIPGDSGSYVAWATHSWGFTVDGATLSDCTIEGSALGAQFGAGVNWTTTATDSACVAGPAS